MAGALSAVLSRPRRRFDGGGTVDDGQWDDGSAAPAPSVGALIQARQGPSDASNPDTYGGYSGAPSGPPSGGALSSALPPPPQTPQEKIDRSTDAANAISADIMSGAGIQTPSYLTPPSDGLSAASRITDPKDAPDATNLPMLAAGAAMLAPTKTGSFSESLGAAFAAAVPVAMKQREITESNQLRAAQMEQNAAIWGQRNQNTANRNDTYADSVAARAAHYDAQDAIAKAKAANPHATAASYQEQAVQDLMSRENPKTPGQNYTRSDAVMMLKGITQRTDISQQNADTNRDKVNAQTRHWENTDQYAATKLELSQRYHDDAMVNSQMGRITSLVNGGMGIDKAKQVVLGNAQPAVKGQPTMPKADHDASIEAGKAAIKAGKDPAIVKQKLEAAGIYDHGI